jgi:hypothetical protein
VSKRTRGQPRRRPAARPTATRPATASRTPIRATGTVEPAAIEPSARAIEDAPVPRDAASTATRMRTAHARARAKPGSLLASRAATEYIYVGRDLRRIALVAAILFGVLIVLWVVIVLAGLSELY